MHVNELLLWLGTHVKRIIKKKLQKYIPDFIMYFKGLQQNHERLQS